jgi:hypothetical protein
VVHDTVRKRRERVRAQRFVARSGPASGAELFGNKCEGLVVRGRFGTSQDRNPKRLGIGLAQVAVAQLSASPLFAWVRKTRRRAIMKELKRILLAIVVATMVTACAFAQKNNNDNRPPKENPKIIEHPKPPPSNTNNNSSNSNKKKP